MPGSAETKEQDVQTEAWTQENGVCTDEDWLLVLRSLKEQSEELAAQAEALEKQEAADKAEHDARVKGLEKMKEEKTQQYRSLLDKIESVRVKLELNNSKTVRKNFTTKIEELSAERDRRLEAKRRLDQDLEKVVLKLKTLAEEKQNEKLSWEQESVALQREKQTASGLAEEANRAALKDEIAAVESHRHLGVSQIEDWIADAEKYLITLRSESSSHHNRQRLEWEKHVTVARNGLSRLQTGYNENLKRLQKGEQLDRLPTIPLPPLPNVPTIPLVASVGRPAVPQPHFHPAHSVTPPPPPAALPPLPAPFPLHGLDHHAPGPKLVMPTAIRTPTKLQARAGHASAPKAAAHVGFPIPSVPTLTPQALPPNMQTTGKLDKVLEKLGMHFPQCTRLQLTRVLQQIKTERGTMAGMSIDHIKQQVEQKLAQNESPAPGPIAPPSRSRHLSGSPQRGPSVHPPVQPPAPRAFPSLAPPARKLCLMCQNQVEPGTQYNTNCLHTLHKNCISVWLQTSKNNSCPFCPSK